MKLGSVILLALYTTISIEGAQSRSAQPPLSIAIAAEHDVIKAGTEVVLKITLTNISDYDISLSKVPGNLPQAESEYSVQVHVNGNSARESDYGRNVRTKKLWFGRSRESYTLKPGESTKDGLLLTKLYDLSRPGTYVIQVSRAIPQTLGSGSVQSNTIKLTVTN